MPRFAIIGTVEIAPGRMDELLSLLMAHRARCLKDEPATLQFEVLMPDDDNTKVMLYEVYQDEAALDAHSTGPSIARLREEAAGMIVTVSRTRGTLLE
jgi:(4S)-4-hydroxy-5-phosphonooxypentane-2,3-dione isomerase